MARARSVTVRFPVGGVVKRFGYQGQPPFTAVDALNAWPHDRETGRERGGSRPGLSKVAGNGPGSGSPVRMLQPLNAVGDESYQRVLMAVMGGTLYRRTAAGTWSSIGGTFATNRAVHSAPYFQKLFLPAATNRVYDLDANTLSDWVATGGRGTVPAGCTLACTYKDRVVLSGAASAPHEIYLSKAGDPLDWLYADTNPASAVAFTEGDLGIVGDPISALIPHNRDCLLVGSTDGLWVLRGDPGKGGYVSRISHTVGPLTSTAWCKTSEDATVMLTRDGIYAMASGCGDTPIPISRNVLPYDLSHVDPSAVDVTLAYDTVLRAVHIYLAAKSGTNSQHWLLDWENKGFWPIQFASGSLMPTAACLLGYVGSPTRSSVVLGCRDGVCRQFDRGAATDDGTGFASHVVAGPMRISPSSDRNAMVQTSELIGKAITGATTYSVLTGDSAELSVTGTAGDRVYTRALGVYRAHPRLRGHGACVRVDGAVGASWSMEEAVLRVEQAGDMRR